MDLVSGVIAVAGATAAIGTSIGTLFALRSKATSVYVDALKNRLDVVEKDKRDCAERLAAFTATCESLRDQLERSERRLLNALLEVRDSQRGVHRP